MGCGGALSREHATGNQKRQVFDLPRPVVEVTEHRAHSCGCPECGTETPAAFPAEVSAATQYGATVVALVVYLQAWQLLPEDRLAELMRDVFGVEVATATIAAMGQRKAQELAGLAEHIEQRVKDAAVKHVDETGYRIAGVLQWLHVASTWLLTCYRTSAKRGAMWEGVRGILVHDFWRP
jgi:transposase